MSRSSHRMRQRQEEYFRKGLEQDFNFIQLVLLLIKEALPIKNIDIQWHHHLLPHKVAFANRVGTRDAQEFFKLRPIVPSQNLDPNPHFCNLVNDFGRKETISCARSDVPAEERARKTRKPQVYTCHAGLVDICVPIFSGEEYLGCIYCGQVLTRTPNEEGFENIRKQLADLEHIQWEELRKAYFQVPVVKDEEIDRILRVLLIFADYLANSWQRLKTILETETRLQRELPLRQKEFVNLLLSGASGDLKDLETEVLNLGFTEMPEQVLVVEERGLQSQEPARLIHQDILNSRLLNDLTEVLHDHPNTLLTCLRRGEFIILMAIPQVRNRSHGKLLVRELAQKLLNVLTSRGVSGARVGIGSGKRTLAELCHSYEEALAALAYCSDLKKSVIFYQELQTVPSSSPHLSLVLRFFEEGDLEHFRDGCSRYLAWLRGKYGENAELLRYHVAYFLDLLGSVSGRKGLSLASLKCKSSSWLEELSQTKSGMQILALAETLVASAVAQTQEILQQNRVEKRISNARRYINEHFQEPVSLKDVAAHVGLSESYFSRQFKKATGVNFQIYLQMRRVHTAMNLLLQPHITVTDCALQVGFNDRAYFSKVFKELMGITPSQFVNDPSQAISSPFLAPATSRR